MWSSIRPCRQPGHNARMDIQLPCCSGKVNPCRIPWPGFDSPVSTLIAFGPFLPASLHRVCIITYHHPRPPGPLVGAKKSQLAPSFLMRACDQNLNCQSINLHYYIIMSARCTAKFFEICLIHSTPAGPCSCIKCTIPVYLICRPPAYACFFHSIR
jgi:hypothetical protein